MGYLVSPNGLFLGGSTSSCSVPAGPESFFPTGFPIYIDAESNYSIFNSIFLFDYGQV